MYRAINSITLNYNGLYNYRSVVFTFEEDSTVKTDIIEMTESDAVTLRYVSIFYCRARK